MACDLEKDWQPLVNDIKVHISKPNKKFDCAIISTNLVKENYFQSLHMARDLEKDWQPLIVGLHVYPTISSSFDPHIYKSY
jgi:hypothetical protein